MEGHSSSLDSPQTSKVLLIQLMEVALQPTRTVSTTLSTGCGKYREDSQFHLFSGKSSAISIQAIAIPKHI